MTEIYEVLYYNYFDSTEQTHIQKNKLKKVNYGCMDGFI